MLAICGEAEASCSLSAPNCTSPCTSVLQAEIPDCHCTNACIKLEEDLKTFLPSAEITERS